MKSALDSAAIATGAEYFLAAVGAALLAGILLRRRRGEKTAPGLAPWAVSPSDFLLFLILAVAGACAVQIVVGLALRHLALSPDLRLVLIGGSLDAGVLLGTGFFYFAFSRPRPVFHPALGRDLRSGAITFLVALCLLTVVTPTWQWLLGRLGLPLRPQPILNLFSTSDSLPARGLIAALAVLIAPVAEEALFRAGLFRYLRTRCPRWIALLGPALLFGALHVDWKTREALIALAPLTLLGLVFSLAYERTGRIGTTIVAHALFNLNTVILVLAGVSA